MKLNANARQLLLPREIPPLRSRPRAWIACPAGLTLMAAMVACGVTALAEDPRGDANDAEKNAADAKALERFVFDDDAGKRRDVSARALVEARDGGLLLEEPTGRLWTVEKPQLVAREATGEPFAPLSPEALGRRLAGEIGGPSEVVITKHYVICSRAGKAYAQWCGALFERLFAAFQNYWKQRGVALREPEFPLPALIFADARQFAAFATADAGPDAATAKGYYSIATNRIALYDLAATAGESPRNQADIARRLAAAPYTIATVVHEATHQIAFNSGMHTRYADNPLWLAEGMAMFFETPDLTSRSGWKTVGALNDLRLRQFHETLAHRRGVESLTSLLGTDARFTSAESMGDAYAEAWALSYFLIRTKREAYVAYLNRVAAKPRLVWDTPETRLAEFREAFGENLDQLDAEFVKAMRRAR